MQRRRPLHRASWHTFYNIVSSLDTVSNLTLRLYLTPKSYDTLLELAADLTLILDRKALSIRSSFLLLFVA
jgi:hypothetical protein